VAKREWLTGTDQPNGVRPVWVPHLRRANRPPQVEEFVCGCVFFWSTSLWVSGPLSLLAWIASSCGVRFLSKPEGQLASASSAPLGSISNRVGGKFGKSSLGTIFTAGKLEPQFECVLLSMKPPLTIQGPGCFCATRAKKRSKATILRSHASGAPPERLCCRRRSSKACPSEAKTRESDSKACGRTSRATAATSTSRTPTPRRNSFGGSTPGPSVTEVDAQRRGNRAVGVGTALPNGHHKYPSSRRCHNGMV
jgi:hypothetical protein